MTAAEVRIWGRRVGAVSVDGPGRPASFQYDQQFARENLQLSPIQMPVKPGTSRQPVFSFPSLNPESFRGLPGMLADCLPDKFGNSLIDAWLAQQGRSASSFDEVERLCYVGTRGMGALEFSPAVARQEDRAHALDIGELANLAAKVTESRGHLNALLDEANAHDGLADILSVGTSAGGQRAKAVIAFNETTQEARSGQLEAPAGFTHWLLKFDGVDDDAQEFGASRGYGAVEYAYSLMAKSAGIEMMPCRLLEENGRRHFMTRRFDRLADGSKLHLQSLAALGHYDLMQDGAHSYEQAFLIARTLGLSAGAVEELFRRMVFNIVARNQDDHVKNIAFLMTSAGEWLLSPAFDITYAFNPEGRWTSSHQMTVNGKRSNFTLEDLQAAEASALLKRGALSGIVEEILAAVARWNEFAERAGVGDERANAIKSTFVTTFAG